MMVGGMFYSVNDRDIGPAAAQIGRHAGCGEGRFDLRQSRIGIAFEQFGRLDHHPVLAKPALRSLLLDPGLLNRVKHVFRFLGREALLSCPPRGQAFERGDFLVCHTRDRRNAGPHFLAFDQNGASSALCESAAKLRTNQLEIIAQNVEQWSVVRRLHLAPDSIHIQREHKNPLEWQFRTRMTLFLETPVSRGPHSARANVRVICRDILTRLSACSAIHCKKAWRCLCSHAISGDETARTGGARPLRHLYFQC